MTPRPTPENGFSLLEALIAMAILAIAAGTLIGAAQTHLDRIAGLEHRTVAYWVAENQLTELRVLGRPPAAGAQAVDMAGETWRVDVQSRATDNPELIRVDIRVHGANDRQPAAALSGFLDVGAAR